MKATNTTPEDGFGRRVALSDDGNTLVVPAEFETSDSTDIGGDQTQDGLGGAGVVYVY